MSIFLFHDYAEYVLTSQLKWEMSPCPQQYKFLSLYSVRLNLLEYMGLPIIDSSCN